MSRRKQLETKHLLKKRLMDGNNLQDCIEWKYEEHGGTVMFDTTTSQGRWLCIAPEDDEETEPILILDHADCIEKRGGFVNGEFIVPRVIMNEKRFEQLHEPMTD